MFRFSGKKMHFERGNAFQNAESNIFFPDEKKKMKKKTYVPTLPKIFKPYRKHTFLFGLTLNLSPLNFVSNVGFNTCLPVPRAVNI